MDLLSQTMEWYNEKKYSGDHLEEKKEKEKKKNTTKKTPLVINPCDLQYIVRLKNTQ